jgi:hypothetical protein
LGGEVLHDGGTFAGWFFCDRRRPVAGGGTNKPWCTPCADVGTPEPAVFGLPARQTIGAIAAQRPVPLGRALSFQPARHIRKGIARRQRRAIRHPTDRSAF